MTLVDYERHASDLAELEPLQDRVEDFADQLVRQPHLDGSLLEDIAVTTGLNTIEHKLGRGIRGWWVARDEHAGVKFKVSLASDQTSVASNDVVEFDTVAYEYYSVYSDSTFKFTAPLSGLYSLAATVRVASLADGEHFQAYIVNSTADNIEGSLVTMGAAADGASVVSGTTYLVKDETSEVKIFFNAGPHTVQSGRFTWFGADLLTDIHEEPSSDDTKFLSLHSDCDRTLSVVVY